MTLHGKSFLLAVTALLLSPIHARAEDAPALKFAEFDPVYVKVKRLAVVSGANGAAHTYEITVTDQTTWKKQKWYLPVQAEKSEGMREPQAMVDLEHLLEKQCMDEKRVKIRVSTLDQMGFVFGETPKKYYSYDQLYGVFQASDEGVKAKDKNGERRQALLDALMKRAEDASKANVPGGSVKEGSTKSQSDSTSGDASGRSRNGTADQPKQ